MAPKEVQDQEVRLDEGWQNLCDGLSSRLGAVRTWGIWTDCEVAVGKMQTIYPAHRILLAAASPVLSSIIFGPHAQTDNPIALPTIEPSIFDIVLDFIYTDKINISSCEVACSLYEAAEQLKLSKVLSECRTYLLDSVSARCAIFVYEFAKRYKESNLIEKCLKLINTETVMVLEQIEVADADMVAEIFSLPYLDVESEMNLFKAAERWLQKQASKDEQGTEYKQESNEEAKTKIRKAIQQIRFLTVDNAEFAAYDTSALLSESEMLAILMNLSSNMTHIPMPEGFSTSREPRIATLRIMYDPKRFGKVVSKEYRLHNVPWRIKFHKTDSDKILLDIECNWEQMCKKWECTAEVTIKILSRREGVPHFVLKEGHTNKYRGYGNFRNHRCRFFWPAHAWAQWTDPANGYVKNGFFTVEAKIVAMPPVIKD